MRDTSQLERRIEGRTNTIARTFDRIVALLTEMDYLRGDEVTEHGKRLARLYGELDLLASECLREGVWEGLAPAELAACASALVYESRMADDAMAPKLPSGGPRPRSPRCAHLGAARRPGGGVPDHPDRGCRPARAGPGLRLGRVHVGQRQGLDEVLREAEMPAGDFVRWCKQVIDVLGQIAAAAPPRARPLPGTRARRGRAAAGVVAYSSWGDARTDLSARGGGRSAAPVGCRAYRTDAAAPPPSATEASQGSPLPMRSPERVVRPVRRVFRQMTDGSSSACTARDFTRRCDLFRTPVHHDAMCSNGAAACNQPSVLLAHGHFRCLPKMTRR